MWSDNIKTKVAGWYVYRDSSGRFVCSNQKPGIKGVDLEGPYTFGKAQEVAEIKNKGTPCEH